MVWNGTGHGTGSTPIATTRAAPLGKLLHEPLASLGSATPELDALLTAHAVLGRVADHLWAHTEPSALELDRIVTVCVRTAEERLIAAHSWNGVRFEASERGKGNVDAAGNRVQG